MNVMVEIQLQWEDIVDMKRDKFRFDELTVYQKTE